MRRKLGRDRGGERDRDTERERHTGGWGNMKETVQWEKKERGRLCVQVVSSKPADPAAFLGHCHASFQGQGLLQAENCPSNLGEVRAGLYQKWTEAWSGPTIPSGLPVMLNALTPT